MGKLTAATVKALRTPGLHADGVTLYLSIAPGGSKNWIQRITIKGKRHDLGLGGWPVVSLEKARRRALVNRVAIADGRDPLEEKRRASIPDFETAARTCHHERMPSLKPGRTRDEWLYEVERDVFPKLGKRRVDEITRQDVLDLLLKRWTTHPGTSRKIRSRMRLVFSWCQARGFIESNPAGEGINGALPRMAAVNKHHRALRHEDVRGVLETVAASNSSVPVKLAFRLLVLTATRKQEIRLMRWSEVDTEKRLWTIPKERMKAGRPHIIPLPDEALAVLHEATQFRDESEWVFPSLVRPGQPMATQTLIKVLQDLKIPSSLHGFRTSFRTWCDEVAHADFIVAEHALAHATGSQVERSYARSTLIERRRSLMAKWAHYISGSKSANVVKLYG